MELQGPTSNIKDLAEILKDGSQYLYDLIGKDYQKFATKYNFALKDYLYAKSVNLSKIKMAFFSSEVVELDEIYVPQNIEWRDSIFTQTDLLDVLSHNKKIVVSATAGSGKSCLLKSIFLDVIKNEDKLLPLFLELKKVNDFNTSIFETLRADIAIHNIKFNENNLDYLLGRDSTILFLDGFDEVNHDLKNSYIKELNSLSNKYPNLLILVSSRPEADNFRSWSTYNVVRIEPLDLSQVNDVINKLNYDESLKRLFLQDLNSGLFYKHEDFYSNPLLLTIMLVTYEHFGDMPGKAHIFYDQAYQALFSKHDVSKHNYQRQSLTNLDIHEFRKVFSLFCLTTYCNKTLEVSEEELDRYLKSCIKNLNLEIKSDHLKIELLNNIPLLMRDGLKFCFTHRSFQEYFTAYYLTNYSANLNKKVFQVACSKYNSDNVADMMFDINKEILEDNWILPSINEILAKRPEDISSNDSKLKLLNALFSSISLIPISENREEESIGYVSNKNHYFLEYLVSKYNYSKTQEEVMNRYFGEEDMQNTNEEILFIELYLRDKKGIKVNELSVDEQDLIFKANAHYMSLSRFDIFEGIKEKILLNRANSQNNIEYLILGEH